MAPRNRTLERLPFKTPRSLDFLTRKELVAQVGHRESDWPFVVLKELVDNALDACEEARIAPVVGIAIDERGITVTDNGLGIPPELVEQILDFDVRVSSREAYMAPDRGRQGNGLKTMVAIPFVMSGGDSGKVWIEARGIRHNIEMKADRIRQVPAIDHKTETISDTAGTSIFISWPNSSADLPIGQTNPIKTTTFYKTATNWKK
jgi:DNA topoisomerase VI subunit B